ncbi:SIMPL domain-containing protein [Chitinophagaceae bacterium LB-8]|uniref:SIMPL domain-containing protein n=1 Tax=Paraflavisolibacter caeni TaxID=2982496 RepID=A0A9X2XS19_9BACT|nr:SIMPL domain-containing protein [Paraflavisolibacter caeni]MCU7547909.1 SIMPL domain-containing protein [Paraflavisolibacter caeni]
MKRTIFILLSFLAVFTVSAQEFYNRQRVVNVQASAETEITPDEIYVQVILQEYDKKGSGKKVDINTIKNEFLSRMKKLGLTEKEISVQSFSGSDGNYWYWYKKNKKNPDLKASINYLIKLGSVKQIEEVVQNLDDEATQNFFIQKVTHSKIEDYKKQLKAQALKQAREKANFMAETLGAQVGDVLQINEPQEIIISPYIYRDAMRVQKAEAMSTADEPALNVDFKKIKLRFEAPVSFLLK